MAQQPPPAHGAAAPAPNPVPPPPADGLAAHAQAAAAAAGDAQPPPLDAAAAAAAARGFFLPTPVNPLPQPVAPPPAANVAAAGGGPVPGADGAVRGRRRGEGLAARQLRSGRRRRARAVAAPPVDDAPGAAVDWPGGGKFEEVINENGCKCMRYVTADGMILTGPAAYKRAADDRRAAKRRR